MSTISFITDYNFNQEAAENLLKALDKAEKSKNVISAPENISTIRRRDKEAMQSFVRRTFISSSN